MNEMPGEPGVEVEMKGFARNAIVMLAMLTAVGVVWAAQPVSEKLPLAPGGEVDIEVLSGTVTIEKKCNISSHAGNHSALFGGKSRAGSCNYIQKCIICFL